MDSPQGEGEVKVQAGKEVEVTEVVERVEEGEAKMGVGWEVGKREGMEVGEREGWRKAAEVDWG